jgi:hypothetical protein
MKDGEKLFATIRIRENPPKVPQNPYSSESMSFIRMDD